MLIVNVFGLPGVTLLCEGADSATEEQVEKATEEEGNTNNTVGAA